MPIHSAAIEIKSDVEAMRREGQASARASGAGPETVGEVALLVTELGTNLLRHAQGGLMSLEDVCSESGRMGIKIVATDNGPGIPSIEDALRPGFSTVGGLGEGLPLVQRLSDSLHIQTTPLGTTVEVIRWLQPARRSS